ncbi:hypothetical protein EI613_14425 [Azospirillum sp. 412522]|nr:hypothetical protein [Azospirillum sp. 412522]MBY6263099.1 hypothetical protein [Azospirillum sp. 412522]
MDIIILLSKWVAGPTIGIIITVLLTEPLRDRLVHILNSLGSKRNTGISGLWKASFYFGENDKDYVEYINIYYKYGIVVGAISPSEDNYIELRKVHDEKPLRVRGTVKDNMFFSGTWFHPVRHSHHTGEFTLLISRSNDVMIGQWLGYSESHHRIESNKWVWTRVK